MPEATPKPDRRREVIGLAVIGLVVAGAVYAIYRQRDEFVDTVVEVGPALTGVSLLFAVLATAAAFPLWRSVLRGLDAELPVGTAMRVFFVSQLGKYLPGSVWPIVMQMEAGRARGVHRRSMLSANLLSLLLTCTTGLILACAMLPAYRADVLRRYWWALLALPVLLSVLHPRTLPAILDRALSLIGREPMGQRVAGRTMVAAVGWSLTQWLALGLHLTVLCGALGHTGFDVFFLCTGGIALAVSAGVLFLPAPAGAGVREVVLGLVLSTILSPGEVLAVVIASRVLVIVSDLLLAALAAVLLRTDSAPAAA